MFDVKTLITLILSAFKFDGTVFPPQAKLTNNTSFDYIIVGGGTAGCYIASLLAEDQKTSVLVLEAGGNPTALSMAPPGFAFLAKTKIDFDYKSTFDPDAASAQGNNTRLTSGFVLGGSSVLNHLIDARGIEQDYDNWAEITGEDSWKYTEFLKYLIKSESVRDELILNENGIYHGTDGPIGKSRLLSDDETVTGYLKAKAETGNPTREDLNSNTNTGYAQPLYTIARDYQNKTGGLRQTPSYVSLNPIKDYPNLHVSRKTTVKKIIFEGNTAVGVEAVYEGDIYTFKANKEVILSAGAFNSPQILQLSGIGPKEHLEALGIEVKADLPVGDNLKMPPAVVMVTKTKKHFLPVLNIFDLIPDLSPTKLPFPVVLGLGAWNKSSNVPNYLDISLILNHDTPFLFLACSFVHGYTSDICTSWQEQTASRDAIYSLLINLEAKSTGTVRLNSTDIFDAPIITTGFYNNPEDLVSHVKTVKDYVTLVEAPSYQKLDAEIVGLDLPNCAHLENGSDGFWGCFVKNRAISSFLYTSTCGMGAVVDGNLKLKGFENIRVVDASVIPDIIHGTTNSAVIALAGRAADLIKESANK